ncbi:MAG: four helix bundle protein [Ruminococcus sp.]|nr:four helix bundle protein [Ruminococcus sp.]
MADIKSDDGILSRTTIDFSVRIVKYYEWLVREKHEYVMSKQILRSSTSIGANVFEANFGASKPDFINKLQIALKEANETRYWLIVLQKSGYYDSSFGSIDADLNYIRNLLIKSINTAKKNLEKGNNEL